MDMIAIIDAEIEKLTAARNVLAGTGNVVSISAVPVAGVAGKKRGRPAGTTNKKPVASAPAPVKSVAGRRGLSPAGRKAIADAMKARWAAKRATGKK